MTELRVHIVALTLCAVVSAGCGDAPEQAPLPELDRQVFRIEVEPLLIERCGNPTTCHGNEGRPFALYAPNSNRRNPADVYRNPPLTEQEHRANYDRTRAFAVDRGYGCELLTKPLAKSAGGVDHEGGDVFESPDSEDFRTLRAWIEASR